MIPFQQCFRDPPMAYRPAPFWFWNDSMNPEEIASQIQQMAEKGCGGFFICARQGLEVPYLSEQWFQLVAGAIEAAHQYGLHTWLYDEYPYPSGMSGGEVTLLHPEARHRQLLHHSLSIAGPQTFSHKLPWAKVLLARAVPVDETTGALLWPRALDLISHIGSVPASSIFQSTGLTVYTRKRFFTASPQKQLLWSVPPGHWRLIIFLESEIEQFKYFGTYMDPCHKEAVQTFLETTYERYADRFHEQFGREIKGFFTDEVGLLGRIPWSARLPDFVRTLYGDELLENLPAVFYPSDEKQMQARYRFFQSLHLLLRESYHQQVSNWCEQRWLQYTTEVPSMRMTTLLHSHIPGGDSAHEKRGRSLDWIIDQNAANLRADPKIASSLANQLGAERAMIECFHSVGWSMTLQDAKWMLDRLAALGINFFVFHAFFFSINGLRKHDAPPSQFVQNPYWPHFRQLADYAGRLSYAMSQGRACVSLAVVHPVTSFWTHMGNPFSSFSYCGNDPAEERALERLKQDWMYLCKQLLLQQIDYDHLDPEILARAVIKDGHLVIGQASYEALILPPLTNLEAAAWARLKEFLRAGGKVISVGLLPYECIEPGQDIEAEVLQWFGLATSPRRQYWRGFHGEQESKAETQQRREEAPWTKGHTLAYFLPSMGSLPQTRVIEYLLALLRQCLSPLFTLEPVVGDRRSFLVRQRRLPDGAYLLFITHQEDTEKVLRLHLTRRPTGQIVERLDLASGRQNALPVERTPRGWSVTLSFAPYESYLLSYALQEEEPAMQQGHPDMRAAHAGRRIRGAKAAPGATNAQELWPLFVDIRQPWKLTAQQDNLLRLSAFHFMLTRQSVERASDWHVGEAGLAWPLVEARPVINQCADLAARQTLPVQYEQSFGTPVRVSPAYPLRCWYQASFLVKQLPPTCKLIMDEDAIGGNHTFYLNGRQITAHDFVALSRPGFRQRGSEVQLLLRPGLNHLVIHVEARRDEDGLRDPLYLSGPFGVTFNDAGIPVIGEPPEIGEIKSGVRAGYPYFAGTLCFTRDITLNALPREQRFILDLRGWDRHIDECVEVLVNTHSLGVCCWSPYRWEGETSLLRRGSNTIEIRLTTTLSGMLEGMYFDAHTHQMVSVNSALLREV